MKKPGDGTDLFPTTIWGGIHQAQEHSPPALDRLCAQYHPPLLIYLRRRGIGPHEAADLVQGFFAHLLSREFLVGLRPGKGRFRAFLIASLLNFMRDEGDHSRARKRGGDVPHVSLSEEGPGTPWEERLACSDLAPDLAYERAWAETVLETALENWRTEQTAVRGEVVVQAIEQVMYRDPEALAYQELADQLGVSRDAIKMAAMRLRQRLAWWIRNEVEQTLAESEDLEDELHHLIRVLKQR